MLFNSMEFIAGFLPVVLLGFFLLTGSGRQRLAVIWLTVVSLVFYGWWNPVYVPLLVGSMLFNYLLGGYLRRHPSRRILALAVAANALLLSITSTPAFSSAPWMPRWNWAGASRTSSCRWPFRSSPSSRLPTWSTPMMA